MMTAGTPFLVFRHPVGKPLRIFHWKASSRGIVCQQRYREMDSRNRAG